MDGFNFKKKYGQNFLIDDNIVKKIVDIDVKPKSLVIEIGSGDGRLTRYLCSKFDKVIAYEIDEEVKDSLLENLKSFSNFSVYFGDFLKRDVIKDLEKENYEYLYIISNLPYYITTPIIEKIISLNLNVEVMRFMVQKEVGDRFSAKAGTKEYGSLSVYLNYHFSVVKDFVVSRNSFMPKPSVDSVVVSFYNKDKIPVNDIDLFYKLVKDSFRFKRKTLKNNLKDYDLDIINDVLGKYGLDLSVRAENLPVSIFCEISNSLSI